MQFRLRARTLVTTLLSAAVLTAVAAQSVFADQRDFTLINNTSVALAAIHLTQAGSSDWEENVLGTLDPVDPGASVDISFPEEVQTDQLVGVAGNDGTAPDALVAGQTDAGYCLYDIKVIGMGGETGFMYGVDLCSTSTVTFSDRPTIPTMPTS